MSNIASQGNRREWMALCLGAGVSQLSPGSALAQTAAEESRWQPATDWLRLDGNKEKLQKWLEGKAVEKDEFVRDGENVFQDSLLSELANAWRGYLEGVDNAEADHSKKLADHSKKLNDIVTGVSDNFYKLAYALYAFEQLLVGIPKDLKKGKRIADFDREFRATLHPDDEESKKLLLQALQRLLASEVNPAVVTKDRYQDLSYGSFGYTSLNRLDSGLASGVVTGLLSCHRLGVVHRLLEEVEQNDSNRHTDSLDPETVIHRWVDLLTYYVLVFSGKKASLIAKREAKTLDLNLGVSFYRHRRDGSSLIREAMCVERLSAINSSASFAISYTYNGEKENVSYKSLGGCHALLVSSQLLEWTLKSLVRRKWTTAGKQYPWRIDRAKVEHRQGTNEDSYLLTMGDGGFHTSLEFTDHLGVSERIDLSIEVALKSAVDATVEALGLHLNEKPTTTEKHWGYLAFALSRLLVACGRPDLILWDKKPLMWHHKVCEGIVANSSPHIDRAHYSVALAILAIARSFKPMFNHH